MAAPSICTKSQMIASIADRWKASYYYPVSGGWDGRDKKEIYDRLVKERPTTAAPIAEIIGDDSWTRLPCDGCNQDSELLVTVGAEPDYDSSTASICPTCLRAALALVPQCELQARDTDRSSEQAEKGATP